MKPDDFEKRLQSQPLRQIPSEWRAQMLQTAKQSAASTPDPRPSLLSTIIHQLSTPLWFNPAAWTGLAAVWIVILALQSASHGNSPKVVTASATQPSVFLMSLKEERQTLAELMGNDQPGDADKPRHAHPQPRSELHNRFAIA